MSGKDSATTVGLERLNALLGWWGVSKVNGGTSLEGRAERFQKFVFDLRNAYAEALERDMAATLAANERLVSSLQDLIHSRNPRDVMTAQASVIAALLDGVSHRARTWTELSGKIQQCCAAMGGSLAVKGGEPSQGDGSAKPSAKHARQAGQRSRAHLRAEA